MSIDSKYYDRWPSAIETCAIAEYSLQKRAALLFDRIHLSSRIFSAANLAKEHVSKFSEDEKESKDYTFAKEMERRLITDCPPKALTFGVDEYDKGCFRHNDLHAAVKAGASDEIIERIYISTFKDIIASYAKHKIGVTPIYPSIASFIEEFQTGNQLAFQAALNNIPTVAEEQLTWDQVIEFRQDKDAVRKYRNLRTWLHDGIKADSLSQATDIVAKKLDDYEWSIRKHGLKSVIGAISSVLSSKQISAIAAASGITGLFAGNVWGALTAGLLITSKAAVCIADRMIEHEDVYRGMDSEVAFIYDVRKKLKVDGKEM